MVISCHDCHCRHITTRRYMCRPLIHSLTANFLPVTAAIIRKQTHTDPELAQVYEFVHLVGQRRYTTVCSQTMSVVVSCRRTKNVSCGKHQCSFLDSYDNRSQRNCIQSTLKLFRRGGYSYTTYAIWIQNDSLYVCFHSRLQRFAKWHTATMQSVDKCYSK